MQIYSALVAILLGLVSSSASQPLTSATVNFRDNGSVAIKGVVKLGEHPRLVFRSQRTRQILLNSQVGVSNAWKEFVDKYQPDDRI